MVQFLDQSNEPNINAMKKIILLVSIFSIFALLYSCSEDCETFPDNKRPGIHPKLEVVNNLDVSTTVPSRFHITGVRLTNYTFGSLDIPYGGGSQTFTLANGMNAGLNDQVVTVYIKVSGQTISKSVKADFENGETTKVVLIGDRIYSNMQLKTN
jgi:hypothetical protein